MPCCLLCPEYKNMLNVEPRVSSKCPGGYLNRVSKTVWKLDEDGKPIRDGGKSYPSEEAPPIWYLLKTKAYCCDLCPYFKVDNKDKFWWCLRPLAFEVKPDNAAEALKISDRSVVPRP